MVFDPTAATFQPFYQQTNRPIVYAQGPFFTFPYDFTPDPPDVDITKASKWQPTYPQPKRPLPSVPVWSAGFTSLAFIPPVVAGTNLAVPINNISSKVGSNGYTAGSGLLVLISGDGAKLPKLDIGKFYRFTVVTASLAYSPNLTSLNYTVYKATQLDGDTLSGVVAIEGTLDQNYNSGDIVQLRVTAGSFSDLQTALNTLEKASLPLAYDRAYTWFNQKDATTLSVLPTTATTRRSLGTFFGQVFRVRDYGAVGNGFNDDTLAIQACMNAAAAVGGTVYFDRTNSFYRITSLLLLKTSATGDSMPKIKMDGPTNGLGQHQIFQLKWQNMSAFTNNSVTFIQDYVIDGLWLDGSWDGDYSKLVYNINEFDHGIAIQGVSNITVRNCRIQNVTGDCINIGRTTVNSIQNTPVRVLIEDCQFINPWRNGLQTGFNIDLTIRRCHVEKPGIYNFGFDIESDNNYADGTDPNTGVNHGDTTGIVIEDCHFSGGGIDLTTGYPVPANTPFLQIANHNSTADIINVRISNNTVLTSTRAIGVTGAVYSVPPVTLRGFVSNLAIEHNIFAGRQSANPTTWTSPAGPLPDDYTAYIKYTRSVISVCDNIDTNDSLYGWLFMGLSSGARICGNTFAPQTSRRQIGITIDSGSANDGGTANYCGPCLISGNRFYNLNSPVTATAPSISPATTPNVAACIRLTGNSNVPPAVQSTSENHTVIGNSIVGALNGIWLDAPVLNNIIIDSNYIDASANQVYQGVASTTVILGGANVFNGTGGVYNNLGPAGLFQGNPGNMLTAGGTNTAYSDFEGVTGIGWAAGSNTTVSRSPLYAYHGINSLEIKSTANGTSVITANGPTITGMQAGVPYYVSLMIRAATTAKPRLVNMRINAYDVNTQSVTWNGNLRNLPLDSNTGWTQMALCAIAPPGTVKGFISVTIGTTGSFPALGEAHYIDMVMLCPSGFGLSNAATIVAPWVAPGVNPQIQISGTTINQVGNNANQEIHIGSQGNAPLTLNYQVGTSGTGGTVFGDGAGANVGSIDSSGNFTAGTIGPTIYGRVGIVPPTSLAVDGSIYVDYNASTLYVMSAGEWQSVALSGKVTPLATKGWLPTYTQPSRPIVRDIGTPKPITPIKIGANFFMG